MTPYKCPWCGWTYDPKTEGYGLVPLHSADDQTMNCPGSEQNPRNAETDRRPLWRDLPEEDRQRILKGYQP